MNVERKFKFPIATFSTESDHILSAAERPEYGPALADRLEPPTFVADGRKLWNDLFKPPVAGASPDPDSNGSGSSAEQQRASASVGDLTARQKQLLKTYRPLAAKARNSAKLAFKGENVKLHDEFRVSSDPPAGIDGIIADARLLVAAVRNPENATALKSKGGYIKKDADDLAAAVDALAASESSQESAKSSAFGATDARNGKLNQLYDAIITIQNAARNEFTDRESQTAFRIGIFPPKRSGKRDDEENPPGTPPQTPKPEHLSLEQPGCGRSQRRQFPATPPPCAHRSHAPQRLRGHHQHAAGPRQARGRLRQFLHSRLRPCPRLGPTE